MRITHKVFFIAIEPLRDRALWLGACVFGKLNDCENFIVVPAGLARAQHLLKYTDCHCASSSFVFIDNRYNPHLRFPNTQYLCLKADHGHYGFERAHEAGHDKVEHLISQRIHRMIYIFLLLLALSQAGKPPLGGCDTFRDNQCNGNNVETDPAMAERRWFTPPKDTTGRLVAVLHVEYDSNRETANVTVQATHKDPTVELKYKFNGQAQTIASAVFFSNESKSVDVLIRGSDGSQLKMETYDFIWTAAPIINCTGDYRNGQKGALVEFFGWPHADVAKECAFLAKAGYLGAKLFPAMEQLMASQPFNNDLNPWYFMYQPVSYRLHGRMGTREQLRDTIQTCRSLGVRVYADAVVNHMTGSGNDANHDHRSSNGCTKWGNKTTSADYNGAPGPSPFYTQGFSYTYNPDTDQPPSQEFPAAAYGPLDFHCERSLSSWNDPIALNAGWLTGLVDLNTERENVQERIADYLTELISIGFSGFRVDAAKHIKPDDLVAIFSKLKRNLGGSLPEDFFTWWEVLLGGEAQLLMCNEDSGYNYGKYLVKSLAAAGFSEKEIDQIKIWNSGYPKEPLADCGTVDKVRFVIQNDDHDQQMPGSSSRDMQDWGCVLVKGCTPEKHRAFEVRLFQDPNGATDNDDDYPIRTILSSFYWQNGSFGMPDGLSDCSLCGQTCEGCRSVRFSAAYDDASKGYDSEVYTRVHRDADIINAMRAWVKLPPQ
ncbi:hypothetical protein PROFUN_00833 [Planoprotostelium fungivorum]|uniref:Alpha-amylase n=1 Tax=Planoprotostelium fungivorum TaxID=1890364 RepID=A0A2P6P061_9EUKA|nr:hypothetical protein PROFUN_00833 [Planoprotostelium fungivorum]